MGNRERYIRAKAGLTYLFYRKGFCEKCGVRDEGLRDSNGFLVSKLRSQRLTVHHLDHNPGNNEPSNLQTLCRKCHDEVHGIIKN